MSLRPTSDPSLERGLKVICIGGGTGLSTLLKGLKGYVRAPGETPAGEPFISSLSGVVTVSDDGGSSGRLRKDFNIPPPGDIRNCIVALSEDEDLLARLFQFRFPEDSGLRGHSFGNLFLTALNQLTGDFSQAVELSSAILKTKGKIFPVTTANIELEALMHDGSVVRGETLINASEKHIVKLRLVPPDVAPLPETLEAIASADLITVGPGSLFTSLISNLLVPGMPEAIAESRALKVFICNLMNEANESLGLDAGGYLQAIYSHAKRPLFDYVLVNSLPASPRLAAQYAAEGACQVAAEPHVLKAMGLVPIAGDFLEEAVISCPKSAFGETKVVARHATRRVAAELMRLARSGHPNRVKVTGHAE